MAVDAAASSSSCAALYRKLDQREHVLLRPGMYVGSITADSCTTWVYDEDTVRMVFRKIEYVPALYKIFDEILMNAIDHSVRLRRKIASQPQTQVQPVRNIRVTIDKESGAISVFNDGDGIDVDVHPEHGCYVPELIFGHLLTSANYDDETDAERTIGGQNGIGAKACNIFSSEFVVETVDAVRKRIYVQRFCGNMSTVEKPEIKYCAKKPYTCIRFTPDYARFGATRGLTPDMRALMIKRVFDATAVTEADVAVHLDGKRLECKTFERYADLYIGDKSQSVRVYEKLCEGWEMVVACSPEGDGLQHVSFVNGVWTMRGGKHVDYLAGQIARKLCDLIQERKKDVQVKPQYVRDNLFIFLKATVPNPSFDSQSKETLTTPASKFGCRLDLSDKLVDKLYKLELVERAVLLSQAAGSKNLKKTDGRKSSTITGIPKLDDANWAGTARSQQCTLILTEGDSAKSMAISGLDQVGRDRYGVYPLRGKVMNVCEVSAQKIAENKEIADLKKILGLEAERTYTSTADLRYGRIMALTDADSVTADTPLLLRDPSTGAVEVRTIDDIAESEWTSRGPPHRGKEYSTTRYEVWSDRGWSSIRRVMRHMTTKRLFRVLTHTGCVDVTEDHSLLDAQGNELPPSACAIGQELMHSFPSTEVLTRDEVPTLTRDEVPTLTRDEVPTLTRDEAWVMGLFWAADGSCSACTWSISLTDAALLHKAKAVMGRLYEDLEFSINADLEVPPGSPSPSCKCRLVVVAVRGGGSSLQRYRDLFYDARGEKRVPPLILNAPEAVRRAFYDGYYAGYFAGYYAHVASADNAPNFDVSGKLGAMGIFYLCRSLGFFASISVRADTPEAAVYTICLDFAPKKGGPGGGPNAVKSVLDLGVTAANQYVYDLETDSHHFHAGVGQMIVHNTDGTHIKGLIMNLFQRLWPSLLAIDGFFTSMLTPIVKARRGAGSNEEVLEFFNTSDLETWKRSLDDVKSGGGWQLKYYKGLGTSTAKEAKEYFRKMRMVVYRSTGDASMQTLDLAFNKKRADDRKEWLLAYDPQATLDYGKSDVTYEDFVHRDLVHFSNYDLVRSIPSVVDGLKVSQRKVLFAVIKRNVTKQEVRVASLSGIVQAEAAYHHGDASLNGTIVSMAQDFVGSNNVNLLVPNGQFGTRIQGGKDHASPRYIHTLLSPLTSLIFPRDDDGILEYLDDDGTSVEPRYYLPILPMVLVNGALGIGTGFSTTVPCHNPLDVIAAVEAVLAGAEPSLCSPWYRFYGGVIRCDENERFSSSGRYQRDSATAVRVTELPLGVWTEDFKELLENLVQASEDVRRFESKYGDTTVDFLLHFSSAPVLDAWLAKDAAGARDGTCKLERELKLSSNRYLSYTNMVLFDAQGRIRKYERIADIVRAFVGVRLEGYVARRERVLKNSAVKMAILRGKVRFLAEVIEEQLPISKMNKAQLETTLDERAYERIEDSFDYLVRMPMYSMTLDKKRELEQQLDDAVQWHQAYEQLTPSDIWRSDLEALRKALLATGHYSTERRPAAH